jgi:hypothetical protein
MAPTGPLDILNASVVDARELTRSIGRATFLDQVDEATRATRAYIDRAHVGRDGRVGPSRPGSTPIRVAMSRRNRSVRPIRLRPMRTARAVRPVRRRARSRARAPGREPADDELAGPQERLVEVAA